MRVYFSSWEAHRNPPTSKKSKMNLHLTIENVTKLAELIATKYSVTMDEAMQLAEFNLQFASSYAEAAALV